MSNKIDEVLRLLNLIVCDMTSHFFHAIGRKGAEIGANIRAMLFVLVAVLCLLVAAVYVADQAVCQPHTAQSFSA